MTRFRPRSVATLAACSLLAVAWFAWLRPISLGGNASYVIVDGISMEPTFGNGDLVLARRQSAYRNGDIVAFRVGGRFNDRTLVIHRIVGGNASDGYITQGDNRDSTDPWRPTNANMLGRATQHVPFAGRIFTTLRSPMGLATLGAAAVLSGNTRRKRKRRRVLKRRRQVTVVVPSTSPTAGPA